MLFNPLHLQRRHLHSSALITFKCSNITRKKKQNCSNLSWNTKDEKTRKRSDCHDDRRWALWMSRKAMTQMWHQPGFEIPFNALWYLAFWDVCGPWIGSYTPSYFSVIHFGSNVTMGSTVRDRTASCCSYCNLFSNFQSVLQQLMCPLDVCLIDNPPVCVLYYAGHL